MTEDPSQPAYYPPGSAPSAPPPPPTGYGPPPAGYAIPQDDHEKHEQDVDSHHPRSSSIDLGPSLQSNRFRYDESKWKDLFWLILFAVHIIFMIIVAGVYGPDFAASKDDPNMDHSSLSSSESRSVIGIFVVAAILGTATGAIWLLICKKYAGKIIILSFVMTAVMTALGMLVAFATGMIILGIVFLLMLLFLGLYYYVIRNRIEFTQAMISTSVESLSDNKGPFVVALVAALAQIAWLAFWSFVFAAVFHSQNVDQGDASGEASSSSSSSGFAVFFLLLSLYWTTEVIKNIGHVTTAGVVATWWFDPHREDVTKGALKRACTTSLGSICFGSLIVAFIKTLHAMVQYARNAVQRSDQALIRCLLCILDCLIAQLEALVRFFNFYAYTEVAIYGKDYLEAAKHTWDLFKARGFDLIISADLTGMVCGMGMLFGGVVTGLISGLWAFSFGASDTYIDLGLLGFVIGAIMVGLMMNVLLSAVATTFVVWAEDPHAISLTRTEQYNRIRDGATRAFPGFLG